MTKDCEYCHKSLDAGKYCDQRHSVCIDEYWHRVVYDICTSCGEKSTTENGEFCTTCISNINYRKYPGP